ncbi:carbohydrate ABC transporter ATP-binding protein, CUT1 family [Micromonospora echinaurantiaca]|uniref:Carbohydrate ABC transporter ATP-binding protein, CUT1 family n=1 Tax=Micromonospora echinaurantiaca TaxID=47857 RepID=A0A1C5IA41_9ACTN|nr:ABC transporter ATP-binding protein [Micromonospora echinaurantiaca]SCG55045.1 carbohydrate ABC transporter ATP-binding protein, CUT1 family [Micromonospora echinaurantiaca]
MSAITMRELTKVYPGGVRALDALDLEIADGEFFALLGPSGCGKTTLLRTIAGLEIASGGSVHIGERNVTNLPPGKRDVAMVFQDYALFPHMTVQENIAYPLRIKKVDRRSRADKAAETADELGLSGLLARRPGQLSGGQQQRVALARAMACHPQVFLLDEPLSNLDARLRLEARTFLKRLQRELGVTTVFVTHDQAEALALADRIAVMEGGRIRQVGTPTEVFRRPANTFVAGFIGSTPMNLVDAQVDGDELTVGRARLPLPDDARGQVTDGERLVYGVRPEYLDYSPTPVPGALTGQVVVVENLGSVSLVSLDVPGDDTADAADADATGDGGTAGDGGGRTSVQVVVAEGGEPEPGDTGWVVPRPGRSLLYRDGDLVTAGETASVPAPRAGAGVQG